MRTRKDLRWLFVVVGVSCLGVLSALSIAHQNPATAAVTRPVVSEATAPLEAIAPVARDGHRGQAFLRKPPGPGPFPAVVVIHGGLVTLPTERVRDLALGVQPSRLLAAGYVVAVITYRSRDHDPQSTVSREDSLAAVAHVRQLPYVDRDSVVVSGCSGGGDLALEVAAATDVAAIVPEEPATVLLTGIFNTSFVKQGERYTPLDAAPISADPQKYYTPEYQSRTRAKLAKIRAPILILQGDQQPINRFNAAVLIPELRGCRQDAGGDDLSRRAALLCVLWQRTAHAPPRRRSQGVRGHRSLRATIPPHTAQSVGARAGEARAPWIVVTFSHRRSGEQEIRRSRP